MHPVVSFSPIRAPGSTIRPKEGSDPRELLTSTSTLDGNITSNVPYPARSPGRPMSLHSEHWWTKPGTGFWVCVPEAPLNLNFVEFSLAYPQYERRTTHALPPACRLPRVPSFLAENEAVTACWPLGAFDRGGIGDLGSLACRRKATMPFHVRLGSWAVVTQLSPLANVCKPVQTGRAGTPARNVTYAWPV